MRFVLLLQFSLLLAVASVLVSNAWADDFPPVSQLEGRPEMPDPLTMLDGAKVISREQWESERRPELKKLFQHYMYGFLPPRPEHVAISTTEPKPCMNGKAILRQATIAFLQPKLKQQLHLLVITPAKSKSPPPVFLGMNFCGNHAVLDDPAIDLPTGWVYAKCAGAENERATDKGRGTQQDVWNVEKIIDRGYALATFYSGDIDADTPDFSDGIAPAYYKAGPTMPAADDPGTIACWAWGYHRAIDCLTDSPGLVDPRRIAVVGHSRNGKTALLAAAMDERIALAIPLQAGCGGTAPSRGTVGESVKKINTSFPHWFCDEFTQFNDNPALLPFDQNCLVALCAPRPVLLSNAQEDTWANPDGQFAVLQAAEPVYTKLYGTDGLAGAKAPELNKLVGGRLGYFLRPGKHSMTAVDWEAFLDFADKQMK
jgi:hypothetical protein